MRPLRALCVSLLGTFLAAAPAAAQEVRTTPLADYAPVRPWGRIQTITGPGYGYDTSYSSLQSFFPIYQGNVGLLFGDVRGHLSNTSLISANLGAGYRYYSVERNRIFGVNAFYDQRDTGNHDFHQVGFGLESLSRVLDVRSNFYFVVSSDNKETLSVVGNPAFIQHFIRLDRFHVGEGAMSGFDFELGVPISCARGLKAYVGTYNYQVSGTEQAWGIKGRLEERLTDNLDFNLTYANDRVFGNSVIFEAGFRFGGRQARSGSSRCDVYARRGDRVERNQQIVVVEQTRTSQELAINPLTGQPVFVNHVASYAAPGGDGTFERPFQTLPQVQAASGPHQIIYAWANSVFAGQSITLQPYQRFLGEGDSCPHTFTSVQGTFLLPRATAFSAQPQIVGAPGNAVTLADFNEVSGFVITGAGMNGIFGDGVTGFDINCNVITGSGRNGIFLDNVFGTGRIVDNVASSNAVGVVFVTPDVGNGIFVRGASMIGDIAFNTASSNGTGGSIFTAANSGNGSFISLGSFAGNISGNTASGNASGGSILTGANSGNGIFVAAGSISGSISGNTASDNASGASILTGANSGNGIFVSAGSISGSISGNTASDNASGASILTGGNAGNGIFVSAGSISGSISGNTASDNASGASILTGGNAGNGIFVSAGPISGGISGNTASGNASGNPILTGANSGNGIFVSAGPISGAISGNSTSGNASGKSILTGLNSGNGMFVSATSITGVIEGNVAADNASGGAILTGAKSGNGILLEAANMDVTIRRNTATGNGSGGSILVGVNSGTGITILSTGAGDIHARLFGNSLLNNAGPGFVARNASGGTMCILLDTTNTSPTGFLLDNSAAGAGVFTLQDNGNNTGTINTLGVITPGLCP